MVNNEIPVPYNEMDRIINLADFNLDLSNLEDNFKDLTTLAAKIAGTPISLINLIDSYTQWTIANHGLDLTQMPRQESVCQYTIMGNDSFEVKDLTEDQRFKNKFYVTDVPNLRYYLGIPLVSDEGFNIGALCVLDTKLNENTAEKRISPEKIELLKIIANQIVQRLKTLNTIKSLQEQLHQANIIKKRVVHDIRGPIGGIIGLAQIINEQGKSNNIEEVLEFINLIHQSGSSLLELADEILSSESIEKQTSDEEFNLGLFKQKLEKLYGPQAKNKNISFKVNLAVEDEKTPLSKDKLLQIVGNLISNAIKFTPQNGLVEVDLELIANRPQNNLNIVVKDSGVGLSAAAINIILNGEPTSTVGTNGEQGYGFGLALVRHLVDKLNGSISIASNPGKGTAFKINVPQRLAATKADLQTHAVV